MRIWVREGFEHGLQQPDLDDLVGVASAQEAVPESAPLQVDPEAQAEVVHQVRRERILRDSARRQFVVTLFFAPALGRGLGHELQDSWSWEMWGPVLCFCTIWGLAALIGHHRRGAFA